MPEVNPGDVDDGVSHIDEDRFPVIIVSRYRLATKLAHAYNMDAALIVDEDDESSRDKYGVSIMSACKFVSIPWNITVPVDFHAGLRAAYTVLEQIFPCGKPLGQILTSEEAGASLALSESGPLGG